MAPYSLLGSFEKFLSFGAEAARAHAIPDEDEPDGDGKDQSGDSINFRGDAAAEAAPDFEWQSIVPADEEESDGDFVHGEREDKQAGGNERKPQIRQSDAPEGLPRCRAKVERSFFLRAVHFLQAREEFGGGNRDQRRAMAEKDGEQTELSFREDCKHE